MYNHIITSIQLLLSGGSIQLMYLNVWVEVLDVFSHRFLNSWAVADGLGQGSRTQAPATGSLLIPHVGFPKIRGTRLLGSPK